MKNTLNECFKELKYIYYSKIAFILVSIMILSGSFFVCLNTFSLNYNYNFFVNSYEYQISNGEDVDELLQDDFTINTYVDEEGTQIEEITNPLKYDYETVISSLNLVKPASMIKQVLDAFAILIIPTISIIFSLYISTYEYKYKTIKVTSVRSNWTKRCFSKVLAIFISNLISLIVSLIFIFILALILYTKSMNTIPIEFFNFNKSLGQFNISHQIMTVFIISILFSIIGFTFGLILKKMLIPIIVYFIYYTTIPLLGKYDFKNLIYNLSTKNLEFNGVMGLPDYINISNFTCIQYIIIMFMFMSSTIYFVSKNQNKYI